MKCNSVTIVINISYTLNATYLIPGVTVDQEQLSLQCNSRNVTNNIVIL